MQQSVDLNNVKCEIVKVLSPVVDEVKTVKTGALSKLTIKDIKRVESDKVKSPSVPRANQLENAEDGRSGDTSPPSAAPRSGGPSSTLPRDKT